MIAAYNRSNVLRFAIETVLAQTLEDWELWVIGDACTDDTEDVVASFGDERLHFVNLEQNVAAAGVHLSPDVILRLDLAFEVGAIPGDRYPPGSMGRLNL